MIKKYLVQFNRYILLGITNTMLTFLIIFLMLSSGKSDYFSNFIGFSFGMILSFLLHSKFTFKDTSNPLKKFPMYLLIVALSYLMNLSILYLCLNYYSLASIPSQFLSLSFYVFVNFSLLKLFVFKEN